MAKVDHDGEVLVPAAEGLKLGQEVGGFGNEPGRVGDRDDIQVVQVGGLGLHRAQQRLGMQHADDVVRIVPPQRQPGVRAGQHLLHDVFRRLVDIDRDDLLAVRDDIGDLDIGQIQNGAQHGALVPFLLAGAGVQVDDPAQFLLGMLGAQRRTDIDSEEAQRRTHDDVYGMGDREQDNDHGAHDRGHREGHAVRMVNGVGLGQHLGEDQDQQGHAQGGVGDAGVAEEPDQEAGGERRGHDVDQVVAQKNRPDQPVPLGPEFLDQGGAVVSLLFQGVHARQGCGGQRCLRAGEKRRNHEQHQYGADRNHYLHFHCRNLLCG
jgi:hypothetical protein